MKPARRQTTEYTEADIAMCRARERQLIEEAERFAAQHREAAARERKAREVAEYAAYRAEVRARLAGTGNKGLPDSIQKPSGAR